MATAPVLSTPVLSISNGYVTIPFTSSGATSERLILERAIVVPSTPLDWVQVRNTARGTLVSVVDWVTAIADLTYRYRVRATNADGSGSVYSNTVDIVMQCLNWSAVTPMDTPYNYLQMNYATSRNSSRGRSTTIHKFAGRRDPVAEKAMQRSNSVDINWICQTWIEVEQFMELMLNQDFWYRDNSGRSFHAVCSDIQVADSQVLNQFTLSTTLTRIDGGIQI